MRVHLTKFAARKALKTKPGMTMPELIVCLVVTMIVASFAYALYIYVMESYRSYQTQQSISILATTIEQLYSQQGGYLGLNNNALQNSDLLPRSFIRGNALISPLGGPITVASGSDGTNFSITLGGLKKKACVSLSTNQIEGWGSVSVNGRSLNRGTVVSEAVGNCSDTGNSVTFVSH